MSRINVCPRLCLGGNCPSPLDRARNNYEISIPLTALHWQPKPGETYRGDLGVLRGANGQTTQRVYWNNKATAITADVPSEAELSPKLWGKWKVVGK